MSERSKILAVTTSRADYGILRPVLRALETIPDRVDCGLLVSGSHLSERHGMTVREIERDDIAIMARAALPLDDDSPAGLGRSVAAAMSGCADAYARLEPDCLLVVGDRLELHAAVVASAPFGVPVAHIHGGELTFGAIDDALRHSITKLSHLHFVATEAYGTRVRQLGEEAWRVTVVGAPALDGVATVKRRPASELASELGVPVDRRTIVATFHPETIGGLAPHEQIAPLLEALSEIDNPVIFAGVNADPGADAIRAACQSFAERRRDTRYVESLGITNYYGALAAAGAMVGNSSSGIVEAASFGLPVVNVGERQSGRVRGENVIDVPNDAGAVRSAIDQALSVEFRRRAQAVSNPYFCGGAAAKIASVLGALPERRRLLSKRFVDLAAASHST